MYAGFALPNSDKEPSCLSTFSRRTILEGARHLGAKNVHLKHVAGESYNATSIRGIKENQAQDLVSPPVTNPVPDPAPAPDPDPHYDAEVSSSKYQQQIIQPL